MAGHGNEVVLAYLVALALGYIQNRPYNAQRFPVRPKLNSALCPYPMHGAIVPLNFYLVKMLAGLYSAPVRRANDLFHILIGDMAAYFCEGWPGIGSVAKYFGHGGRVNKSAVSHIQLPCGQAGCFGGHTQAVLVLYSVLLGPYFTGDIGNGIEYISDVIPGIHHRYVAARPKMRFAFTGSRVVYVVFISGDVYLLPGFNYAGKYLAGGGFVMLNRLIIREGLKKTLPNYFLAGG